MQPVRASADDTARTLFADGADDAEWRDVPRLIGTKSTESSVTSASSVYYDDSPSDDWSSTEPDSESDGAADAAPPAPKKKVAKKPPPKKTAPPTLQEQVDELKKQLTVQKAATTRAENRYQAAIVANQRLMDHLYEKAGKADLMEKRAEAALEREQRAVEELRAYKVKHPETEDRVVKLGSTPSTVAKPLNEKVDSAKRTSPNQKQTWARGKPKAPLPTIWIRTDKASGAVADWEKFLVHRLRAHLWQPTTIATSMGRDLSQVSRILKEPKYAQPPAVVRQPRSNTRKVDPDDPRIVDVGCALKHLKKNATAKAIYAVLLKWEVEITLSFVRRILRQEFLYRKWRYTQLLTAEHKAARVEFAKRMLKQTKKFPNIVFSDEKMFKYVDHQQGGCWVCRGDPPPLKRRFRVQGVMAFLMISPNARFKIYWYKPREKINSARYVECLRDHMDQWRDDFVLQEDNASVHTTEEAVLEKKKMGYKVLVDEFKVRWPANSPDLNPVENVWSDIVRHLQTCNVDGNTHLKALVEAYLKTPRAQQFIRKVCLDFEKRLHAVIEADGENIQKFKTRPQHSGDKQ